MLLIVGFVSCISFGTYHSYIMLLQWQFKMELAQTNTGNTPKSYSLNMFKDFVPMCVFSESNQGRIQIHSLLALHCFNARLSIYDWNQVYCPDRHDLPLFLHGRYPLILSSNNTILFSTVILFGTIRIVIFICFSIVHWLYSFNILVGVWFVEWSSPSSSHSLVFCLVCGIEWVDSTSFLTS